MRQENIAEYAFDKLRKEIRLFIRKIQALFFNRNIYSSCSHCGRTWNICDGRDVGYAFVDDEHTEYYAAMFAVCTDCWNDLKPEERLEYYLDVLRKWMMNGKDNHNGLSWEEIENNLREQILGEK